MPLPCRTVFSEIYTSGYPGEWLKLAGIPNTEPYPVPEAQVEFIFYVEAITCRTYIGAVPASQASFLKVFPDACTERCVEQLRNKTAS